MLEILKDVLSKTNDWIKFAEAKNAANIILCSGVVFSIVQKIDIKDANIYVETYFLCVTVLLLISLIISLLSFVPKLKMPWIHMGNKSDDDNFIYFGHAYKYSARDYLSLINSDNKFPIEKTKVEIAYSNQIVTNSKIAYIKFKQFDIAVWYTISAIVTPLGTLLIWFFLHED